MSTTDVETMTARLVEGLRLAHAARRGVPARMELEVRAYARAQRDAGVPIGRVLVEVKDLVRTHTGQDDAIFIPRVVGWTVAGFFQRAVRKA